MLRFARSFFAGSVLCLSALAVAVPADAGSVSYSSTPTTFGPTLTDWSGGGQVVAIPLFNNQNGTLTLTGVTISLAETVNAGNPENQNGQTGITLTATTGVAVTGTLNASGQMAIINPFSGDSTCNGNVLYALCTTDFLASTGAMILNTEVDVAGNSSTTYATSTESNTSTNGAVASQYVSDFSVNGTQNENLDLVTATMLNSSLSGGSYSLQQNTADLASVTVTYTYNNSNPAPEPASLAILGTGLAALGAARRRKNRR